jgi:hypothetical protein
VKGKKEIKAKIHIFQIIFHITPTSAEFLFAHLDYKEALQGFSSIWLMKPAKSTSYFI